MEKDCGEGGKGGKGVSRKPLPPHAPQQQPPQVCRARGVGPPRRRGPRGGGGAPTHWSSARRGGSRRPRAARPRTARPSPPAPGAARARSGGWFQPPCTFARVDRRSEAAESWGWLGARTTANEAQLLASWLLERHSLLRSLSLHRHHPVHPQRLQLRPGITLLPFSWKQTKTRVTPHTQDISQSQDL